MPKRVTRYGITAVKEKIAALESMRSEALKSAGEAAQEDPNSYHDNFSYEEGMRMADLLARQIDALQDVLKGAVEVPLPTVVKQVSIGHVVTIEQAGCEPESFLVCGDGEGGVFQDACSASSPLGQALLGMNVGESREVSLPGRSWTVTVQAIRHASSADFRLG
jgi:transcription elongation GreA/GreB family factor